ncbi:MAG: hypothetical protein RIS47_1986 [Bacteroidota bacterium]
MAVIIFLSILCGHYFILNSNICINGSKSKIYVNDLRFFLFFFTCIYLLVCALDGIHYRTRFYLFDGVKKISNFA